MPMPRDTQRPSDCRRRATGSRGFTLIELMIVIAILGILVSVAIPQYETYQKRSRFTAVTLATEPFKTGAEAAFYSGRVTTVDGLDAGVHGIPAAIGSGEAVSDAVDTVTIADGVITAVGTSLVGSASLTLRASIVANGLRWSEDDTPAGSCQSQGIC